MAANGDDAPQIKHRLAITTTRDARAAHNQAQRSNVVQSTNSNKLVRSFLDKKKCRAGFLSMRATRLAAASERSR